MNTILIENGIVKVCDVNKDIHIDQNLVISSSSDEPVDLQVKLHFNQSGHYTMAYHILKNSKMTIIEERLFETDLELERKIIVEEDASLSLFVLDDSNQKNTIKINEEATLSERAIFKCGVGELSNQHIHSHLVYNLEGSESQCFYRMAVLASEKEKKHYEVTLNHHAPHTYGQMDNYGVAQNEARLIIDGVGRITKGNYDSSTHQTNKIIVFDPKCHAEANPYLYIDEYDVKASHAAGVGRMDDEHLYYLQSRGLTKAQAMHLITYGYLIPVTNIIDNEDVKNQFILALEKKAGV